MERLLCCLWGGSGLHERGGRPDENRLNRPPTAAMGSAGPLIKAPCGAATPFLRVHVRAGEWDGAVESAYRIL